MQRTLTDRRTSEQQEKMDQLLKEKAELIRYCSAPPTYFLTASLSYISLMMLDRLRAYCEKEISTNPDSAINAWFRKGSEEASVIYEYEKENEYFRSYANEEQRKLELNKKTVLEYDVILKRPGLSDQELRDLKELRASTMETIANAERQVASRLLKIEKELEHHAYRFGKHKIEHENLAVINRYYEVGRCFLSFIPVMYDCTHQRISRYYQNFFYPSLPFSQMNIKTSQQAATTIKYLEDQVESLKKIAQRNKRIARCFSICIIPIAIYQLFQTIDFRSIGDAVISLSLFFALYGVLEIASRDFFSDFDFSHETRQKNEIIKAKQILKNTLHDTQEKYHISLTVQEGKFKSPDTDESHQCISLIFQGEGKTLKRSALVLQIELLFQKYGLDCVDKGSNYISFSISSLLSLIPEKVAELNQELEIIATRTRNTDRLLTQFKILANEKNIDFMTYKPESDENGLRIIRVFIGKNNSNNHEAILKLFSDAEIVMQNDQRIELLTNLPLDEDRFKTFLSPPKAGSRKGTQQTGEDFHSVSAKSTTIRAKTSRHVTKQMREEQEKEKEKKEREEKRKQIEEQKSKDKEQALQKKERGEYITGRGITAGIYRLVNNLKRSDFPSEALYDAVYDQVCQKINEAHMAGAREGAIGFVFIDPKRVTFNGKIFDSTGKYKFKGDNGNISIYCRQVGATYYAESVDLKHAKQRHNKI